MFYKLQEAHMKRVDRYRDDTITKGKEEANQGIMAGIMKE